MRLSVSKSNGGYRARFALSQDELKRVFGVERPGSFFPNTRVSLLPVADTTPQRYILAFGPNEKYKLVHFKQSKTFPGIIQLPSTKIGVNGPISSLAISPIPSTYKLYFQLPGNLAELARSELEQQEAQSRSVSMEGFEAQTPTTRRLRSKSATTPKKTRPTPVVPQGRAHIADMDTWEYLNQLESLRTTLARINELASSMEGTVEFVVDDAGNVRAHVENDIGA